MAQAVSRRLLNTEAQVWPGSVYMRFMVDKVALGQGFFRVLRFSPVSIIPQWLSILIQHLEDEK
jgi:hypothetical protein